MKILENRNESRVTIYQWLSRDMKEGLEGETAEGNLGELMAILTILMVTRVLLEEDKNPLE